MDRHLTRRCYEMLMRGQIPPRRFLLRVFRHLLDACETCDQEWRQVGRQEGGSAGPPTSSDSKQQGSIKDGPMSQRAVERVVEKICKMRLGVDEERLRARALLTELLELRDPKKRVQRVRRSQRFRSWTLCELLVLESRRVSFTNPAAAESLAELALEASWSLEDSGFSRPLVSDLLARGWAALANARRMASELAQSEETFLMAYFFLEQGSGDPMVLAEVIDLEASLRRDQRQIELALKLLDKAIAIYRRMGEDHLQGRTLLLKALTLAHSEDPDEAIRWIRRGLELIDPERDPRLTLCCHHSLVVYVNRSGRHAEAAASFETLQPLYGRFQEPWIQLRRLWLEAEIAEGLGDLQGAESIYRTVRDGFLRQGIGYDAALVSLNLAALFATQGRNEEIRELATDMLQVFESRDLHREAIATLIVFQRAAQQETVTFEMVQGLARYLRQARHNPKLRYEAPS